MFASKRLLKKEKTKRKYNTMVLFMGFVLIILSIFELIYLNFSFGRVIYLSPIAKNTASQLSILENDMDKNGIKYTNVTIDNDGSFNINLSDSGEVILSSKKDLQSQLSSLQLILSRLTIEGKRLKVLDFRFNHPVVSF